MVWHTYVVNRCGNHSVIWIFVGGPSFKRVRTRVNQARNGGGVGADAHIVTHSPRCSVFGACVFILTVTQGGDPCTNADMSSIYATPFKCDG